MGGVLLNQILSQSTLTQCEDGKGGAGGVARSPSSFLGAWSKPYPGVMDPLIAEAMAVRDGVIFANLRGFSNVVMVTDCLEVVSGPLATTLDRPWLLSY